MVNQFTFYEVLRSDKGVARRVVRLMRHVEHYVMAIEVIERALQLAEQEGQEKTYQDDFVQLVSALAKIVGWITDSLHQEDVLEFRELRELGEADDTLKRLAKKTHRHIVEQEIKEEGNVEQQIANLAEKERREARLALQEIQRFLTTLQNRRVAIELKKLGFQERDTVKAMDVALGKLEGIAKRYEKAKEEGMEQLDAAFRAAAEEFQQKAKELALDIYKADHYLLILAGHMVNRLNVLESKIPEVLRKGFDEQKAELLKAEMEQAKTKAQAALEKIAAETDVLAGRASGLARAA